MLGPENTSPHIEPDTALSTLRSHGALPAVSASRSGACDSRYGLGFSYDDDDDEEEEEEDDDDDDDGEEEE